MSAPSEQPPGDSPVVTVEEGAVLVTGTNLPHQRRLDLFLTTLMGGRRTESGWLIPARRRPIEDVVVQINGWLVRQGMSPSLDTEAGSSVRRDAERERSFVRTQEAAVDLRLGRAQISEELVNTALADVGWNFERRVLREHQMRAVIHGLTVGNPANFSVPGSGKTAATLALAAVHLANQTIDMVVVVGPLSCFRPWEGEVAIALPAMRTKRIRGDATERRRRIRGLVRGDIALLSYASAAADRIALIELCRAHKVMLVADESHRIKRFNGGTWAPAVMDVAKHARVRVILSGTPMPQSGRDLYTQLNVLWPGKELTGPRSRFKSQVADNFDGVLGKVVPFVSRTAKAELGLPDPHLHVHDVELTYDEAEIYRLIQDNFRAAVLDAGPNESDRLATLRRGRPMRLLQAATNAALLQSGRPQAPIQGVPTILQRIDALDPEGNPPAKFTKALELIQAMGTGEKVVIWSTFVENLDQFAALLRRETTLGVYQVDGRVQAGDDEVHGVTGGEPETREQVIAGFLGHQGGAVLVTNPASCSESISLHSACHTAIYLDRTYDCAQWLQSIDRIHRLGLRRTAVVRVHVLRALAHGEPTVDSLVAASLGTKEATMRQLLEGAQLQPFNLSENPEVDAEGDEVDLRALLKFLLGETE